MRVIHQSQSIDQCKHYHEEKKISYMQVHILVQRCEQSGSVIDNMVTPANRKQSGLWQAPSR